jgi:membrane protein
MMKDTVVSFIEDEALSSGAAIAFYASTSIAPILLVVMAVAGLVFGRDAAQDALTGQLNGLMGQQAADLLQAAIASAANTSSGILATIVGVAMLMATVSGAFGELQAALNKMWRAKPEGDTIPRLLRARAASIGLVATLGFLLMISLVVSAALEVFGDYLNSVFPFGKWVMSGVNGVVSLTFMSVLFAAIYKVLPDRAIEWGDVIVGAIVTAVLFTLGKAGIAWYLGSSAVASSYGAAGGLIVVLLWIYYSTQVFLLGAEFTKIYANRHGSKQSSPVPTRKR